MFTTQLTGLLKRIEEKEELAIEDGARLLAQAIVGDGHIYLFAHDEMEAVVAEAMASVEPLQNVKRWNKKEEMTIADRVLLFSRYSHDKKAVEAGKWLYEKGIPFIAVSTHLREEGSLIGYADVHIDLKLKKALLPDEEGNRFGYPASIAALFVYYGLRFTLAEILEDYE